MELTFGVSQPTSKGHNEPARQESVLPIPSKVPAKLGAISR